MLKSSCVKSGFRCRNPKLAIVLGVLFLTLSLSFFKTLPMEQFSCRRSDNICTFQERYIWESEFKTREMLALTDIKQAVVHSRKSKRIVNRNGRKKTTTIYYVALETGNGSKELFQFSSEYWDGVREWVDQINAYLKSDTEELFIRKPLYTIFLPFIFVGLGLFLLGRGVFTLIQKRKNNESR